MDNYYLIRLGNTKSTFSMELENGVCAGNPLLR